MNMAEQKHFHYEGNVTLDSSQRDQRFAPKEVKVKKVRFLVPVRIDMDVDGQSITANADMDLANQELFFEAGWLDFDSVKSSVFDHIRATTLLPEDKYEADNEVYDEVGRAQAEHEMLKNTSEEP